VTDIDWMSKHPDLLLVSYSKGEETALGEQEGLVNIWSTTLKTRPECSLICQSEVIRAISHPYRPNEVIGGTYAGYVVLWDIRAKRTPVLKSQLSSEAHSFPIYSLAIVGTEKANTIISLSNNGRMCVWPMEMLTTPQKSIDLKHNAKDICATCIGFPKEESNSFFVGAEDNSVYSGQVHGAAESDADKSFITDCYQSHFAPITSLSLHPAPPIWPKGLEYTHIMLSASMDWTVKMWNTKVCKTPIASFENFQDYTLDVKWSPIHPNVFASCDAEGYVDIWDISTDMESPIVHTRKDTTALHKLGWSTDGKRLATGGMNGIVSVYGVDKDVKFICNLIVLKSKN
jgi:dynein intermediate chain